MIVILVFAATGVPQCHGGPKCVVVKGARQPNIGNRLLRLPYDARQMLVFLAKNVTRWY